VELVYVFLVFSKVDSVHSCCWKLQFNCSVNVGNYQAHEEYQHILCSARIIKGFRGVGANGGEVSVVSLWEHQNGAHDIYFIRFRDTVLRVLVWKMDSTFNCYILWKMETT